jgi:hypothetical protein
MDQSHIFNKIKNSKIALHEELVIEKTENLWIALNLSNSKFYELNSTSYEILNSVKDLVPYQLLLKKLEISYKKFEEKELLNALSDLVDEGLIKLHD